MKNVVRGAAVSTLCAAAFVGLMATSAQAATWAERGVVRTTEGAARGDFRTTEAQCRRNDGVVVGNNAIRFTVLTANGREERWYAYTECRSKRG
jgi:hypothetical protein